MRILTRHVREPTAVDVERGLDVAVVIDVIRAFTVEPWVLRRDADRLLLAPDIPTAVAERDAHHPHALLLKDRDPDPRFALPNAPGRIRERGVDPRFPGVHADDLRLCSERDAFDRALRVRPCGALLEVETV